MTKVFIQSTEELPTKLDGKKGELISYDFMGHEGFHVVSTIAGNLVFHESQLVFEKEETEGGREAGEEMSLVDGELPQDLIDLLKEAEKE
jgi:hypothetical protein